MRIRILIILIIACCNFVTAQKEFPILENSPIKFEHITSSDGLMHNSIVAILQDSKGFMWFGTNNGLYKYDGYEFKFYTSSPDDENTLLNKKVKVLFEDKNGVIWIGTTEGICRYNREKDSFERKLNTEDESSNLITDTVNCIYEDKDGVIWVGTRVGLYQLEKSQSGKYTTKLINYGNGSNGFTSNNIFVLLEGQRDGLWVGTADGLNVLTKGEDGSLIVTKIGEEPNNRLSNTAIVDLLFDKEDNLWVATKYGLNKLSINQQTNTVRVKSFTTFNSDSNPVGLVDNRFSAIEQDQNGIIWAGTKVGGLYKLDPKTEVFTQYKHSRSFQSSLRSNDISDLLIDDSGVLWVGTQRGGLSKLNLGNKKIAHYKFSPENSNSLSGNLINTIYEDSKNNIWIGTFNKGLNRIINTDDEPKFIHYVGGTGAKNTISGNSIFGIVEDDFGNFWIGTQSNGLNHVKVLSNNKLNVKVYESRNIKSDFPTNKLATLYKDKRGDIWAGSFGNDGLIRFTPNQFGDVSPTFEQYFNDPGNINSISNSAIATIFEDSDGILWVGTNGGGLNKVIRDEFNKPIKFIRIINEPNNINSLSDDSIFSVHEDSMGNIWVGTFGGGLNKISKEEKNKLTPKIVRYSKKEGLPSDEIYGILEDDHGNLWISTNNGISKFNIQENSFTNLHLSHGLQDVNFRKFAFHKGANGLMYFGGINGLNVFYPDDFEDNKYLPKVEIIDFKIFGKSVNIGEEILGEKILKKSIEETNRIVLKNAHNNFSIEFAGMHYASPSLNKYAYMLEGFDKEWIETDASRRFAGYSNLEADTYIFKVKSSNNDGLWNENFKTLEIEVLPPYWKSWWAYLIYAALIILLMMAFRRYILINEEYQSKLLIEKIEQEKIKEISKIKLEFFTNVSHEFKTPLTLILGPLQSLIESKETSKRVKESLLLMERNANQLFRLINQIMEFRKVETKEMKLQRSKGDLVNFCKEEIFSFKVLSDKKEINLTFESSEYSIEGFFDWDKMEKILNNLISNSIKYTGEGGKIKLTLSIPNGNKNKASKSKGQGEVVRIVVEDSGEGIPQNQLNLIFDRFYQIEKNAGKAAKGSGIGLAFTKSLIDMHKGTIQVESEENIGSKFIVELPLLTNLKSLGQPSNRLEIKIDNDAESIEKANTLVDGIFTETLEATGLVKQNNDEYFSELEEEENSKKRLLVVEDNPDMLEFITRTLEDVYEIHKSSDGVQGLEAALKIVPDLIISDVMMPNMDGIEFCKKIKENEITSHIPVILLTAKGSMEHRIEGLQVGADSYIPKPFDIRHLEVRIQKLLLQRETLKKKFTSGEIKLDSQKIGINQVEKDFLEKMEAIIEENLTNSEFGVEDLGDGMGYSRMQLYRKLKTTRGLSANEFIREYRIKKAAVYLRDTDMKIYEILYEVGISNHSYFTKCFKQYFNMSPRKYIDKNRGKGSEAQS